MRSLERFLLGFLPKICQVFATFSDLWFSMRVFQLSITLDLLKSKYKFQALLPSKSVLRTYSSSVNGLNCAGFSLYGCKRTMTIIIRRKQFLPFDRRDISHFRLFEFDANKIDKSRSDEVLMQSLLLLLRIVYLITTCTWKEIQIISFEYVQT